MNTIKFDYNFWKLAIIGNPKQATLTACVKRNIEDICPEFKKLDTLYYDAAGRPRHYPLPKEGPVLVYGFGNGVLLQRAMGDKLNEPGTVNWDRLLEWGNAMDYTLEAGWLDLATIRSYDPGKEARCKGLIGKPFKVEVLI